MTHPSDADPKQNKTAADPPGKQRALPQSLDRQASGVPDLLEAARALHERAIRSDLAASGTRPGIHSPDGPLAAVTCMVVAGDASLFSHDPQTFTDLVERPTPENGWRSQSDFRNSCSQRISVELMSTMVTAGLPGADGLARTSPAGFAAHRAKALRSIGEADRRLVEREQDCPADHTFDWIAVDKCGVVDLVGLSDILDALEPRRFPEDEPAPPRRVRRIHGFPTVDSSGSCELVLRMWSGQEMHFRTISIRSYLRRTGSKEIMAVCESLYRR